MSKPDNVINLRPDAATIAPDRPCWAVYEHWVINEKGRKLRPGVYWHSFKRAAADQDDAEGDAGDRPITDEWISSPVTVVARTTNSDDGSEGRLLRLVTEGGIKEWIIAMEVFGGSGEDARRALFGMGVIIALKKRGTFMEYLLDQHPAEVFATTSRPGWHESGAFVLPGRTIGSTNVRYQASNKAQVLFSRRGELALWQSEVAAKCAGNPVLTLAIGCSLAGPLLSLVGVLGGGVHLVGDSSSGKSLAQLIGSSVWGDPGVFAASWDMTKGGLEIEASSRNDTILPLDEIKRADPKRVQEMAYSLANGQGKGTMTREREGRAKLSWRLLTLSSGERSLSEHAAISGNAAHAGAELRMVDVNAGTRTHRAFDELHGLEGADFHRQLTVAVGAHHGHLGPAFVERLVAADDKPGLLSDFDGIRAQFVEDNAQAGRVADRFAVIALAGEMAIAYGLLPWVPGTALADCRLLYGEWLSRVGGGTRSGAWSALAGFGQSLMFDREGLAQALGFDQMCDLLGVNPVHRHRASADGDTSLRGVAYISRLEDSADRKSHEWGAGGPLYQACHAAMIRFIRECPEDQLPDPFTSGAPFGPKLPPSLSIVGK